MMRRLAILGLVIGALALAPAANAATITLTQAQLLSFVGTGGVNVVAPPTGQAVLDLGVQGVQFETQFLLPVTPTESGNFGLTGLNIATTNLDTFELRYLNSNSNPWTWTVTLIGGGGGSDSTSVGSGATDVFSIPLNGTNITGVTIKVTGYFPDPLDRVANSTMAPSAVPEPGTMMLLGTGLIGLAGAVRRRMKK